MALKAIAHLATGFGWSKRSGDAADKPGLSEVIQQLRGLKAAVIAGGSAGDHTVTGIATEDHLVAVLHEDSGGITLADRLAEFTISAANTINNVGGTDTTGGKLVVWYYDYSAGA